MIPINNIHTATNEQVYTGNNMIKKEEANVLVESTGASSTTNKHDMSRLDAPANSMLKVSKTSAFQNSVSGSYQVAPQFAMMQQEQPLVNQQRMMMMRQPHGHQADYMWNPAQQNLVMVPASAFEQMQTMNSPSMTQQVAKQQPQQQPVLDPKKAKKFPMKVCSAMICLKAQKSENREHTCTHPLFSYTFYS